MKYALLTLMIICSCSRGVIQQEPKNESDIPFCYSDKDCTIFRSRCGKVKAFNIKFFDYVEKEYKKREEKMNCGNYPDDRRYSPRCQYNTCELVQE